MNRLRELRKMRGLTLRELSKKVNMSYSSLGYIERGDVVLRADNAKVIANFFNVTVDYLLGVDEERNEQDVRLAFIDKISDLEDEELLDVFKYIDFIKSKRE